MSRTQIVNVVFFTFRKFVVVSTKAHPRRPGKGRGTLNRQPSITRGHPPGQARYPRREPNTGQLQQHQHHHQQRQLQQQQQQQQQLEDYPIYAPDISDRSEVQRNRKLDFGQRYDRQRKHGREATGQDDVIQRSTSPPPPLLIQPTLPGSKPSGSAEVMSSADVSDGRFRCPRIALDRKRADGGGGGKMDAASRVRTSNDISEWLSWRMKVNDRLSSFVMRAPRADRDRDAQRRLPVHDLPSNMTAETLNSILSHADSNEHPATSLDHVSYMIYGVPRVQACHNGASGNDVTRRSGSLRKQKHVRGPLRRKRSSVRDGRRRTRVDVRTPRKYYYRDVSGVDADDDRCQETSCQEESLDFSDECPWPDEYPERLANDKSDPETPIPSRRERLTAMEHRFTDKSCQQLLPRRLSYRGSRLRSENTKPGTDANQTTTTTTTTTQISNARYWDEARNGELPTPNVRYYNEALNGQSPSTNANCYDEARYRKSPTRIGNRQSSFKPPGGVPTILSLYNLPNQSQVPLRHVTTKQKISNK